MSLLAMELPKFGFEPSVVALNRGGYYEEMLRAAQIPVTILKKRFRFDPLTWLRLRRILKQQQPDVVQSYLFSANSYVRLPGICPPNAKVVVSERCVDSWKSGWQLATDRRMAEKMAAMTVNSESVGTFYRETVGILAERIHVIPNAVCFQQPPSAAVATQTPSGSTSPAISSVTVSSATEDAISDTDLKKRFRLPDNARLVAFVGRLAQQKCVHDLIWAFQLLRQTLDDVFLVIAGDGPERDRLADLASRFGCRDKIIFTGHWPNSELLLEQVDAFCLPSSFEGMSNSLMEAMLANVPVAVSDIPANLGLVQHESTGLVFPEGDGPEMAKALKRLLTDQKLAASLAEAAHQKMARDFTLKHLVDRHVQLYRSVCGTS